MVDTKIPNLLLFSRKLYHLLCDHVQMAATLDFGAIFLNFKHPAHIPQNPLFGEYLCQIWSYYDNLKDVFGHEAHYVSFFVFDCCHQKVAIIFNKANCDVNVGTVASVLSTVLGRHSMSIVTVCHTRRWSGRLAQRWANVWTAGEPSYSFFLLLHDV